MEGPVRLALRAPGNLALPVLALLSLYLATAAASAIAGALALALAIALHALVFGPAATLRALPAAWLKASCSAGVVVLILGVFAEQRGMAWSGFAAAGLLLTIGGALALAFVALAGRAHALRDEEW